MIRMSAEVEELVLELMNANATMVLMETIVNTITARYNLLLLLPTAPVEETVPRIMCVTALEDTSEVIASTPPAGTSIPLILLLFVLARANAQHLILALAEMDTSEVIVKSLFVSESRI